MKQLILTLVLLGAFFTTYAQQPSLKINSQSFEKTYQQEPLVIDIRKARQSPVLELPKTPDILWKYNTETVSYYNNHPANPLCFNQSRGWEMIQVRPMKHQLAYEVASLTAGLAVAGILQALGQL